MPQREAAALVAAIKDYTAAYAGDPGKKDILDALQTVETAVESDTAGGVPSPGSRQGAEAQQASRDGMAAHASPVDHGAPAAVGDQPKSFDAAAAAAMDMARKKKQPTPQ